MQRVVQRLLPQSIAYQEKPAGWFIVKRESKHASQFVNTIRPMFFVKMNDDFRVAMSGEKMAAGLQLRTQFLKVINLPIEDDPYGFVFVEDWLVPTRQIDDAQAPHAHTGAILHKNAFVVRAAVHDGLAHPVNSRAIHFAVRMSLDHSCD